MNNVCLIGRLVDDPKLFAYGTDGEIVAYIILAVPRFYKNSNGKYDVDYIKCQAFNERALFVVDYVKKGSRVSINGFIKNKKNYNKITGHNDIDLIINIERISLLN